MQSRTPEDCFKRLLLGEQRAKRRGVRHEPVIGVPS
jgi:hypothetical protein